MFLIRERTPKILNDARVQAKFLSIQQSTVLNILTINDKNSTGKGYDKG